MIFVFILFLLCNFSKLKVQPKQQQNLPKIDNNKNIKNTINSFLTILGTPSIQIITNLLIF